MGLGLAFKTFYRSLTDAQFQRRAEELLAPPAAADTKQPLADLRILAVLQRDGRLLDFLTEEVADYSDAQIGAAVRDIHRDCKAALGKYLTLAPVMDQAEDAPVTVPAGFDPGRIRLTGNIDRPAPLTGTLAHRGWQVTAVRLPERGAGDDVLAPAEVEVS